MSNSLFDQKGKFTPLSDDVLATFNKAQRNAYFGLQSAVTHLDAANSEATDAIAANRAALAALREAEEAEARKPKTGFLDEWRAAKEQYRRDHP